MIFMNENKSIVVFDKFSYLITQVWISLFQSVNIRSVGFLIVIGEIFNFMIGNYDFDFRWIILESQL